MATVSSRRCWCAQGGHVFSKRISRGWADVYSAELPCQWIDVTDVPPGNYKLHVVINPDHLLAETDYSNNEALVDVTIEANSCPGGCRATDETCCRPGDPCGWGDDGSCDCGGAFSFEGNDCATCFATGCKMGNTCPAGCTPNDDPACCVDGDPCGLAENGLPCGLQFIAFTSPQVFAMAGMCERILHQYARPPILEND